MATNVGTINVIAKLDTSQYKSGVAQINSSNRNMASSTTSAGSRMSSSLASVAKVGFAALAAAAVAAGAMIAKNMDAAVKRIDTLVAFPRVLKAMGISSKDAEASTNRLKTSLEGLPTPLQDGARGVQSLVSSGVDIGKATESFLAFNNAMLAANVDAGTAQSTFTQLSQAISRGRIEGAEWNSIAANMPTALLALQKQSGLTKDELRELYRTDPQKLLDDLINLNKKGGGGMASLEEQARAATGGIGTAMELMNTYITQGIQKVVEAFGGGDLEEGQKKVSEFFTAIGQGFKTSLEVFGQVVTFLQPLIGYLQQLFTEMGKNKEVMDGLKIIGLGLAIALGMLVVLFIGFIAAIGLVGAAIAGALGNISKFFQDTFTNINNAAVAFGTWLFNTWNSITNAVIKAFTNIGNFIRNTWNNILNFINTTVNNIKSFLANGWNWITTTTRNTWNNIVSAISNGVNRAVGFVRGMPDKIKGFFSGAGSWLVNAGKSILDGLASGIRSAANVPKKALEGVMAGIRKLLPSSPAKEGPFSGKGWTLYSGMSMMDALASGITRESAVAQSAMSSAMSGIAGSMGYSLSAPSIAPISASGFDVDTSEFSSGGASRQTHIENVYLGNDVDADRFLRKLNNNQEIESAGLTPQQQYMSGRT